MYRCVDDVNTNGCTSEARLVSARSDDDRLLANQQHRLVAFPKGDHTGLLPLLRVCKHVCKHHVLQYGDNWMVSVIAITKVTHVAEEREQWNKRNATRRCRLWKGNYGMQTSEPV